jgi:tetratricopeptide (TPR) repeat protein
VLVEGEGGVGKSRLVRDVVSLLGPTAWVRCHAADAELPLSSIARALRVLAGDPPDLAALPAWVAAELPRLLPELGPPPLPLRSEPERQRLAQALMLAWTAWGRGNFDAVVLDDWHLADDASAALLPQLTAHHAGDGAAPLREILVYRPELAPASAARLQRLRDGGAAHCFLAPLSPEAVLELLQCLSGAARPERFARRIAAATGGHPFHLSETLRYLIERGELLADAAGVWHTRYDEATEDYRELPLPPSVRDAVIVRVQRLDPAARRVLDAAALAAEPFDAALLAPACGLSEVDTLIALEAAHQARLLAGRGAGWGFVHDLVPQSLAAAMDEQRRRSVHRRLALGAAAANAAPALVARHFEAGGEPARAAPYRLAAGDAAERLHALPEAVVQWRAALAALAEGPAPALESASRLRLVRTLRYLGDLAGSAAEVAALVALAPRLDPGPRHDAIAGAAGALWHLHRAAEVLPLLDGLPPAPDPGSAARVAQRRAEALRELGRLDEARAIAETLRAGDALADSDRADLLDGMVLIEERAGRPARALELLAEATALSERIDDDFGVARGRYRRGTLLFHAGELAAAEAELRAGLAASRRLGTTFNSLALLQRLADVALARQRWSEVLALVDEAWRPPEGPPGGLLAFVFRAARVSALEGLGEPAGAEDEARRAADLLLQVPAHLQIEAALLLPLAPLARAAPQQLDTLAQALAAPAAAAGEPGLEWLRRLAAARC